jgi:phage replication-related protein YjqB (UPF0714/DUF867 family)
MLYCGSLAEPRSYNEILQRNLVRDRDFRVAFGDANIEKCLLVAPHGGGIEPGTSEIMRTVAELGGWAWYEFAGYLRGGNKEALHIASTEFDEPTLLALLPQTEVVATFHGSDEGGKAVVDVGGKWKLGRQATIEAINESFDAHGIRAVDATEDRDKEHISGLNGSNITNRGRRAEGIQMEFSRAARNLLFPPDSSREARGRRSARLRPLVWSLHLALKQLTAKNWVSASGGRS